MLTERKIIDKIEVDRDGVMLVKFVTLLERDGVPLGEAEPHSLLVEPGADLNEKLADEPFTLDQKSVAALVGVVGMIHTKDVIYAWKAKQDQFGQSNPLG